MSTRSGRALMEFLNSSTCSPTIRMATIAQSCAVPERQMAKILCKDSVRLKGVTPALAWMFYVLDGLARHKAGLPDQLVITSIYDGTHSPNSRHYVGEAIDIRSKNFRTVSDKRLFRAEL